MCQMLSDFPAKQISRIRKKNEVKLHTWQLPGATGFVRCVKQASQLHRVSLDLHVSNHNPEPLPEFYVQI